MASNGTPSFANTLVSGELSRPWTEHQIYETIYDNNRAIYQSIKGLQINNKGRVIEIIVDANDIYTQLMSTGLQIGEENILFRPYNGVFALLKNVPLEATKDDVLQLIADMDWHITGPVPATRISPQYYINREGRNIISGRWICMLDRFPKVKTKPDGNFDFTHKAFGGRIMAFSISRKRFAATTTTAPDPFDYTQQNNNGAEGVNVANTSRNNSSSPPASPAPYGSTNMVYAHTS